MLHRIHNRFGTASLIVAVVALIAALAGTAFAAVDKLSGVEKKEVKKIAKQFAGKPGASGATGPQGPKGDAGPKGDTGAPGIDGEDGAPGKDGEDGVCSTSVPQCELPPGATLTGVWSFSSPGSEHNFLNISFPLRVNPEPTIVFMEPNTPETTECPSEAAVTPAAEPKAAPGYLCVYAKRFDNANKATEPPTDHTSGYLAEVEALNTSERFWGRGTWAVTAVAP